MLSLKHGVNVKGIKGEIIIAMIIVNEVYDSYGYSECVITSVDDRKHSERSLHYKQLAFDVRTRMIQPIAQQMVANEIAKKLGEQYDVVLEKDHIHIEFDIK